MSFYENVFIARQDITQAQVDGLTETFENIITKQGGSVPKKESWGLRTLAYRIKKNRKGYYVLMNIDAPPAAIQEMERQLHLNEDVLRFLTTRVDELEEGPSAVLKAKDRGDDGDWGRGRDRDRDRGRGREADEKRGGRSAPKEAGKASGTDDKTPDEAGAAKAEKPKAKSAKSEAPEKKAGEAAAKDEKKDTADKDEKKDTADKDGKDQGGDK